MKRVTLFSLSAIAALIFTACATPPPVNTTNTNNANANAVKTTAAAPSKDALVALEKKAWDAWKNKDGKHFETYLADNFVGLSPKGEKASKADVVKMISESKDDVKSFTFSDEQVVAAGADAAILTYKVAQDVTADGKKLDENLWVATVFVRSGSDWKGAYHNEIPVMKTPPKAEDKKDEGTKPIPPPAKKDEKPAAAADDAKPAAPADDPAIASVKKGWDSWKNKDPKGLEDAITKDFVLVDAMGNRSDHAGAMKQWTTDNPCDIKGVTFDKAASTSLTKDVSIVTLKGTADGKCGGMDAGSLWGTYVLVKEGDAWRAAMIFETPA